MKKIAIISAFIGLILTGCLKDDPNVDFSTIKPTVHFFNSGLSYFSSDAVTFPSDTVTISMIINLASVNTLNKDLTVTVGIDQTAFTTYNATSGIKYELMADSSYSLPSTSVTIPAGRRTDTLYVTFYQHTFDPSKSYMLPISITDADGTDLSSNFDTHYYHVIGNPIAGTYEEYWSRWNTSDSLSGEAGALYYKTDVGPVTFSPVSPTEIAVESQGTGETNYISFTNDNGNLIDFSAAFNPDQFDPTSALYLGVTLTGGPFLEAANPETGYYKISWTYNNSSGSPRVIVNEYIKQ